jgi:DNA gyrase subunit B
VIATIQRLSRRIDPLFLEKVIYIQEVTNDMLRNEELMQGWCEELNNILNTDQLAGTVYEVSPVKSEETEFYNIQIVKRTHGIYNEQLMQKEFFNSAEYRSMVELGKQLSGLIEDGAYVQRGERKCDIFSFKQAMEWLLDESKRGQAIQRYKGLGEMNPDQLYETTLNSNTRRLLQVQIEDVVAADEVFTTLMGDQVEPRRDFIESNALSVANLDV